MTLSASKRPIYSVPVPSTDFENGGAFLLHGTILYCYYNNGTMKRSGIRFLQVKEIKMHSESTAQEWHVQDVYDTLVEVSPSQWIKELQIATAERQKRLGIEWDMHHYMIYLNDLGCVEVVASSWEVLPEQPGEWPIFL